MGLTNWISSKLHAVASLIEYVSVSLVLTQILWLSNDGEVQANDIFSQKKDLRIGHVHGECQNSSTSQQCALWAWLCVFLSVCLSVCLSVSLLLSDDAINGVHSTSNGCHMLIEWIGDHDGHSIILEYNSDFEKTPILCIMRSCVFCGWLWEAMHSCVSKPPTCSSTTDCMQLCQLGQNQVHFSYLNNVMVLVIHSTGRADAIAHALEAKQVAFTLGRDAMDWASGEEIRL